MATTKIDYKKPLIDMLKDKEHSEPEFTIGNDGKPVFKGMVTLTLGAACISALNYGSETDRPTNQQSGERYELMKKIKAGEELKIAEKAIIIELAKKAYMPMFSGQIEALLEGK